MPQTSPSYISKTDFKKFKLCPSYFWLWLNDRDSVPVEPDDYTTQHAALQGDQVEAQARLLFPNGYLVTSRSIAAASETAFAIEQGIEVLFQATVLTPSGLFAMADVLTKNPDGSWNLYEVKSGTKRDPEYFLDVAFQKYAFSQAGFDVKSVNLITVNSKYVLDGLLDPAKLLRVEDVTKEAEALLPELALDIELAQAVRTQERPVSCECNLKTKTTHCPTFSLFHPNVPKYSIYNISRISKKSIQALTEAGITSIEDVPDNFFSSAIQTSQVDITKSGEPITDVPRIKQFLDSLVYPLYFLDYETVNPAIPIYQGTKAYQQVVFQYSLDVLNEPGGQYKHYEYLEQDPTKVPMHGLLQSLSSSLDSTGSVLVWNKSFEQTRNKEMAASYAEYANFLLQVNARAVDLEDVCTQGMYKHPEFKGSTSIKYVLPALVPSLSYKGLEIANGLQASISWLYAITGRFPPEQATQIYQNLLTYCAQDTIAMVKIYEHLVELTSQLT